MSLVTVLNQTDPRPLQIAALAGLLIYGISKVGLDVPALQVALILAGTLSTQYICSRADGRARYDPRSALISGLSLILLLRTNHAGLALLAAVITIASKFVLRRHGKHIFNPTNFGLIAMLLLAPQHVWVSPGQWGRAAFLGFFLACAGMLVIHRARRSDVTIAFLASYAGLVLGRATWLGDPPAVPLHHLQNGALLIFAFFMVSDPKTTPDSRAGRILFALLVAAGAAFVQFGLFRTNGLLWSLAAGCLAVPLIDRLLPGDQYVWAGHGGSPQRHRDAKTWKKPDWRHLAPQAKEAS